MDGSFNGRRLFEAPPHGAVLVSGNRLRNPRNVSILDADLKFSAHGFSSSPVYYRDNFSSLRKGQHGALNIPITQPACNESATSPIIHLESNIGYNRNSSLNRPLIREIPIRIVQATSAGKPQSCTLPPNQSSSSVLRNGGFPICCADEEISSHPDINGSDQLEKSENCAKVPSLKQPIFRAKESIEEPSRNSWNEKRTTSLIAMETVRLKLGNGKLVEGDRVVWFDALGMPHRGTVQWIGYLRGHTNVYVGVDFDEAIGGGTGYFEGLELFCCAPNHAGLLPISVCMKEEDMGDEDYSKPAITSLKLRPSSAEDQNHSSRLPLMSGNLDLAPVQREPLIDNEERVILSDAQFTVGSCVEVFYRNERRYGVVKWIDSGSNLIHSNCLVAVDIEGDVPEDWEAISKTLAEDNLEAVFASSSLESITLVPYCALRSDNRFSACSAPEIDNCEAKTIVTTNFGSLDSGIEVRPCFPTKNIESLVGRMKGIQGFRNSCYLDATLYAMFAQCTAFDRILESRCETEADSIHTEVTDILKTEIVYPLRRFHFIRADHVLKLRCLLERLLPEMKGLTTGEKDPEELLNALFTTVLRVEPFLVIRNMTDNKTNAAYICPLITEDLWSEEQRRLISVQTLLERSFFASNIQFAHAPKILILQLPRYGQQKVFDKIFPPQEVDITHLIYNSKRPCINCGRLADLMCPECFLTQEVFIAEVTYCGICYERTHSGLDHQPQELLVDTSNLFSSSNSLSLSRRMQVPQIKLQLASVLCIETSHYVAFVRALFANKWTFFDSMADRVGLSDGYNVPQVKLCEKMSNWLSDTGWYKINESVIREGHLPNDVLNDPDLMRLLSDCYICFYTDEENKNGSLSLSRFLF
ncbi:unnamed protein product [Thelazia callipaeda]|uniref:ubiquitinyl hydrolase 1 n=1 Tax=Thelazia callipaeda TaxID=103827 RepID=A0A158RC92_THECL|nr:unnamed protein product [Thelazia callipaeda]